MYSKQFERDFSMFLNWQQLSDSLVEMASEKSLMMKTKPLLEETLKNMFNSGGIPNCFKMADLGCSSGPNTFLAITGIISTVHDLCRNNNRGSPEFQVFLNDLPGNDFNGVLRSTPVFYEEMRRDKGEDFGRVFISAVAGSFYGRLFPTGSLDFVHSSNSVHWLSQVPDGIEDNKGCICISEKSPPQVFTAYAKQFERDFSIFLSLRGEEIALGGCMVLEFIGRSSDLTSIGDCSLHWQMLADSLVEMASEGFIDQADVDSFNLPLHFPDEVEVRNLIETEDSFRIEKLEAIDISRDRMIGQPVDMAKIGQMVALSIRAILEPMLISKFGNSIIDDLFQKFAKGMAKILTEKKGKTIILGISLTKK